MPTHLDTSSHRLFLYPRNTNDDAYYMLVERRRADQAMPQPLTQIKLETRPQTEGSSILVILGDQEIGTVYNKDSSENREFKELAEFVSEWKLALSLLDEQTESLRLSVGKLKRDDLLKGQDSIIKDHTLNVRVVSWNLQGNLIAEQDISTLISSPELLVVCIQESDALGRNLYANSATLVSTTDKITDSLPKDKSYELVAQNQLLGLMLLVFATGEVSRQITSISRASTGTGLFGRIGNKGACGISFTVGHDDEIPDSGTEITLVNCHLSAGEESEAVDRRRWELDEIGATFGFSSTKSQVLFDNDAPELEDRDLMQVSKLNIGSGVVSKKIWFVAGDLNYRLHMDRELVTNFIENKDYQTLLDQDTLLSQMKERKVLQDFVESEITFPPTFKYNKDSLDERRIPSYCDRILYRSPDDGVSQQSYNSMMEYTLSDHKPVYANYTIKVSWIDFVRRKSIVDEALKEFDRKEKSRRADMTLNKMEVTGPQHGRALKEQEAWFTITNADSSPCLGKWKIINENPLLTVEPARIGVLPVGASQQIRISTTLPVGMEELSDVLVVRLVDIKDVFVTVSFKNSLYSLLGRPLQDGLVHAVAESIEYLGKNDCTGIFEQMVPASKFTFNSNHVENMLPALCLEVQQWMDASLKFDTQVLDEANKLVPGLGTLAVAQELTILLSYIPEKLIPEQLYDKCVHKTPQVGQQLLWDELEDTQQDLRCNSNALQLLVTFLRQLVHVKKQVAKKVILNIFEPILFAVPDRYVVGKSLFSLREERNSRRDLLGELILRSISAI